MPGAGLGLVWLDGRAMTSAAGHAAHAGDSGAMSVRFASFDTSWKQMADMPVDRRVCECCPTTAVVTSDGPIAAFRNRTEHEIRDIYISRFENGAWTEPKAVHDDGWNIPACPVNGPMLSARVETWRSPGSPCAVIKGTPSRRSRRTPAVLSVRRSRWTINVSLGRVGIELLDDGSAIATWIELAEQKSQFRARRVRPSGSKSSSIAVAALEGSRASGYPRVAAHGDELVFAWTESGSGTPRVQTSVTTQRAVSAPFIAIARGAGRSASPRS